MVVFIDMKIQELGWWKLAASKNNSLELPLNSSFNLSSKKFSFVVLAATKLKDCGLCEWSAASLIILLAVTGEDIGDPDFDPAGECSADDNRDSMELPQDIPSPPSFLIKPVYSSNW